MENWQIALYGSLTLILMTVIQYFITAYFRKAEKLKEDEITKVFNAIMELNVNVKILTEKLAKHDTMIEVIKTKLESVESRLKHIEEKLNI